MRIFELVLIVSGILYLIYTLVKGNERPKSFFYTVILFFFLHLSFEGLRWQMSLMYFSTLIISLIQFRPRLQNWLRYTLSIFSILLIVVSGLLSHLLPVFDFSTPSGEYGIGALSMSLTDEKRLETITEDAEDLRKIGIKIWYPSDEQATEKEAYLSNGLAEAFGESKGIPSFVFSHFKHVKTNTGNSIPITNQMNLPVIILSHGYLWNAELYNGIIEELVSQGFVVCGIQHSYEAPLVRWENEQIKPINSYFQAVNERMDYDKFGTLEDSFKLAKDNANQLEIMQRMMRLLPYNESIERWQKDISFVIDELEKLNKMDSFYKHFDLNKIGLLGHSFGGAAVGQACAYDNRVKAGINMDGAQWGNLIDTSFNVPFMALYADRNYDDFFTPNFYIYSQVAKGELVEAIIKGSGHANFGDLGFWTPLHQFTETGDINPTKMNTITTTLIQNFFDKHLNGKVVSFDKKAFPEVEFLE